MLIFYAWSKTRFIVLEKVLLCFRNIFDCVVISVQKHKRFVFIYLFIFDNVLKLQSRRQKIIYPGITQR